MAGVVSTGDVGGAVVSTTGVVLVVVAAALDVGPVEVLDEQAPVSATRPNNTLVAANNRTLLMPMV